ncbi:MAG: DUF6273 domain-containing protein [Defluviitaleaceae bacterium]|nr:DUF6273 domain-containing protein [Defluviitaleaceae bacterium]
MECKPSPLVGSIITFGKYDWLVLDISKGNTLLISKDILELGQYHKEFAEVTWEQCTLRRYLNSRFLMAFPPGDRARIIETRIINLHNPQSPHFSRFSIKHTKDFIFLLSLDEVKRFFPTNEDRKASYKGTYHWWWLRSPGENYRQAAFIKDLGYEGNYAHGAIGAHGKRVAQDGGGIRPVMWVKLL